MDNEEQISTPNAQADDSRSSAGLFRNWISFVGMAIGLAAIISIGLLVLIELTSEGDNPYTVLVTYILLPGVLVFGLFIAGVGALLERRRRRKDPSAGVKPFPILDLNDASRRRSFLIFASLTFIFLFISAFGSYRAFEYTESVAFCGQQCHDVMKPEFVAYGSSPHARVRCVECHVGGGAEWYVRAKLNGMHQLYAVTFRTYNRPIETPVHNMRPANDTCAKCHWSEKYIGDQLRVFDHYGFDENNTPNRTRMLLKVGGGGENAELGGIHWHMNIANEITYASADEKRQDIRWVRLKDRDGKITEFTSKERPSTAAEIASMPKRQMDCIDCHNRPAHIYLSPNEAVDRALSAGRLDPDLPFIKAKAVEALSGQYETNDQALAAISQSIEGFYRTNYGEIYSTRGDSVSRAVAEIKLIYQSNFFPEMKTNWSSHINNIGHYNAQGCFRCHDGRMSSPDGRVIRNECSICHTTIDQTFRGVTTTPPNNIFKHPVELGDKNTAQCAACHKGDRPFTHPLNLGDISRFQCSECHTGTYEKVRY